MSNSLIWKLIHPRTRVAHHLYGTMHVRDAVAYGHVETAQELIQSSELYVGEMNLSDPVLTELDDYFRLQYGYTLAHVYGEHKYKRMQHIILKSYGIDIDSLKHYKPMIVANMITESTLSAEYPLPLDQYLWRVAEKIGIATTGLESGADQIRILQSISLELQKPMLSQIAKKVSRHRKKIASLCQLYQDKDIQGLYLTSKRSLGKLRKPLLYQRNHLMADRLVELTDDGPVFASVGAAHLAGKYGLLRLMKKSGYTILPVS